MESKRKVYDGRKYGTLKKMQEQPYNSSSTPKTMICTWFSSYHIKKRITILIINLKFEISSCQVLQSCYIKALEHSFETYQTNI
jgi:hypothetical protein